MTSNAVNPPAQLLVIGGGYTGRRFASEAQRALGFAVLLTRRSAGPDPGTSHPARPDPAMNGARWLQFDAAEGAIPSPQDLAGTTHVLVTLPPDPSGQDPALTHLAPLLQQLPVQWVGYLSTTGVYGDCQGRWVNETAPLAARAGRSQARRIAEEGWQASGLPLQIFRLPAIYGPHRTPFQALLAGKSRLIDKPGQVFSRVHVDDIVGALVHCLQLNPDQRPAVLNVADNDPCSSKETLTFAAHLLGCPLPPLEQFDDIAGSMSPMARSFWSESRRADNRLLRDGLGYQLRYPSYREGYPACLAEEREGGQSGESAGSLT